MASSTQPALGAIRLAWWRDALERLDTAPPPPEPRLVGAATHLLPRGVGGAQLARIAEGWSALFDQPHASGPIGERGLALFAAGARLLGNGDSQAIETGRYFALADVARRGLAPLLPVPVERVRVPRALRPLTALAALGARDLRRGDPLETEATPGRAWTLLRHRWTGTIG